MIPKILPLDIMGRQTTREQWQAYEMELGNHIAAIERKREFLAEVLDYAGKYGFQMAHEYFTRGLDVQLSMNAPNKPGSQFANND